MCEDPWGPEWLLPGVGVHPRNWKERKWAENDLITPRNLPIASHPGKTNNPQESEVRSLAHCGLGVISNPVQLSLLICKTDEPPPVGERPVRPQG